ncbi:MAG: beta-ketoacyl-ACP synthase III [Lachnospiraceae bacterium]|nr:beta-ketoacyl-ACP synthase III [Lachnospiraceae bacterium]
MSIQILGTGSYLPENIMTNDDLAKIVDTSDEWISSRSGIRQRRISSDEMTTKMASFAAKRAVENAGISADNIDLIIVATLSADKATPNTACQVQEAIGAQNAVCFDISAACSGFVFALNTARAYIETGMANTALLIGAETLSKMMDWTDRGTCVLFGDGAGAAIVTKAEDRIYETVTGSDGSKGFALTCGERKLNNPLVQHGNELAQIYMDGQEVFRFAVTVAPKCIKETLLKAGIEKEQVRYYILHQANLRIIKSVAKRLKEPEEKFPHDVEKYGNTSSASIPILLDEMNREGRFSRHDLLVLCGFGGGLTWGSILLEW